MLVGGSTDKVSWVLSKILSPLLRFVPAHMTNVFEVLKDLHNINNEFAEHVAEQNIASFDVEALYTNVDNAAAIRALEQLLLQHAGETEMFGFTVPAIIRLTETVLSANIFCWSGKYFRQKRGLAMGCRVAPIIAKVFMHMIESIALRPPRSGICAT